VKTVRILFRLLIIALQWFGRNIGKIAVFLLTFLASLLLFASNWVLTTFGNISPESLLFHMQMPLEGSSNDMIIGFIVANLLPSLFFATLAVLLYVLLSAKAYRLDYSLQQEKRQLMIKMPRFLRIAAIALAATFLVGSTAVAMTRLDLLA